MVIYLYGPDSYRRKMKLDSLLSEYKKKYPSMDIFSADFEENPEDWEKVRDFLNQPSIFVDSKIAVVRYPQEVKEKAWREILKKFLKDEKTFMLLSDEKKPLKDFQFLLNAPSKAQEFKVLEGKMLELFVREEARARGLVFAPDALALFARYLELGEERSWNAVAELDKLALVAGNEPISKEMIAAYFNQLTKYQVFQVTARMLSSHDWKERLSLLERLFLQHEASAYIFNSLGYAARGRNVVALADYDISIKSGKLEYEEALLKFALGARRTGVI